MALAAASISSGGKRPVMRTALAVNIPESGWVPLPGEPPLEVFPAQSAGLAADQLKSDTNPIWEIIGCRREGRRTPNHLVSRGKSAWHNGYPACGSGCFRRK